MQTSTASAAYAAQRVSNRRANRAANHAVKPAAQRTRRAVSRRENSKAERAKFEKKVRTRTWMRADLNELDAELAAYYWCHF